MPESRSTFAATGQRWREILALCGAFSLATVAFNTAPLLIGALIAVLGLAEESAGLLMTLELLAMSVVAFALSAWGSRFSTRPAMVSSVLLACAAHFLAANADSYSALVVLRGLAGVSAGFLLLAVNTRVAASAEPVRLYGIVTVATTIVGATMLALQPNLIQRFGMFGAYGALAGLCVLLVFLVALIPANSERDSSSESGELTPLPISTPQILLLMTGIFLIQITQSAFYGFSERLGVEQVGLTPEQMGVLLAVGYLAGAIPGSALASWMSYRFGRLMPLLVGLLVFAVCLNVAGTTENTSMFVVFFVAMNFCYFFTIPYQLGISADLDPAGRLAGAGNGVFFFGLACGPYLGGYLVGKYGYGSLGLAVAAAVAVGIGIYAVTIRAQAIRRAAVN